MSARTQPKRKKDLADLDVMLRTQPKRKENFEALLTKLADNLKLMRIQRGLSQEELAHRVGTTQATYSRIESGVTKQPNKELTKRIAEQFMVDLDNLFTNEGFEKALSKKEQTETPLDPRDIPAILRDLKELYDDGVITEAQFEEKRKELLARL